MSAAIIISSRKPILTQMSLLTHMQESGEERTTKKKMFLRKKGFVDSGVLNLSISSDEVHWILEKWLILRNMFKKTTEIS